MELNRRTRRFNRLANIGFVVLFIALIAGLAALSLRFSVSFDWTAGARATLSEPSRDLIREIDEPVRFVAFVEDDGLRDRVAAVIRRYQEAREDVELEFVNPELEPERTREFGVSGEGEIFVLVGDQRERIEDFTEDGITNAIARALRAGEQWFVFTDDHGEADPLGEANHDLGYLGGQLEQRGLNLQQVRLSQEPLPDNTGTLVIAGARHDFFPNEMQQIQQHLEAGGNLLWLVNPHGARMPELAQKLGVRIRDGHLRDPAGQQLGLEDPSMVVIMEYGDGPVEERMEAVTLFPHATAIEPLAETTFDDRQAILETSGQAWLEDDQGEMLASGHFNLGMLLSRDHEDAAGEQRVAVIGSSDFATNAYVGNGDNARFGQYLADWLAEDEASVEVPVRGAPDRQLDLGTLGYTIIGGFFLIALPALLVISGGWIWWRRRRS